MKPKLLGGVVLSAGLAMASVPGHADPITFTWAPSMLTPALPGTNANIVASNMLLANSATIAINPTTGAFTETAFEIVTAFQVHGSTISVPGYGTNYSLFFDIMGTGTQAPAVPGVGSTSVGAFTSISYTLFAAPDSLSSLTPTFNASHQVSLSAPGAFAVATGMLDSSTNVVTFTRTATNTGVPVATVDVTMLPVPAEDAFFVIPPAADYQFVLAQGNFGTTTTNVMFYPGTTAILTIGEVGNAGGGNANLSVVPEPASLGLLGFGLVALGLVRRRYT